MTTEQKDISPRLAIIVPVFGHPILVCEALYSALDQKAAFGIHIVVVNDGCSDPETDLVLSTISTTNPDRITYLRKPNGGLSSARNFGIRHILAQMQSVEAIFMLDADNRLRPQAMARAMAALDKTKSASWVYPSIDMFGIKARCDYSGPYSRLIHSYMNICEAGSLIRRSLFEAGIMFDETYTLGFEDWHFFLSASDAGFIGVNLEEFGFLYRKRPESMLANADRNNNFLVAQIRQSHPDLFHPVTQVQLEQKEAPRFAIYLADEDVVLLTTDPEMGTSITLLEYETLYWRSRTTPTKYRVPPFLLVLSRALLNELSSIGLLHWAFWRIEQAAMVDGMAIIRQRAPTVTGEIGYQSIASNNTPNLNAAIAWVVDVDRLNALTHSDNPIKTMSDVVPPGTKLTEQPLMITGYSPHVTPGFLHCLKTLRHSRYRIAGLNRWTWRQPSISWRGKEHFLVRQWFNDKPVYPRIKKNTRDVGIIVTLATDISLDIVERILATEGESIHLHLFIMEEKKSKIPLDLIENFESISFLGEKDFDYPASRRLQFLGAFLPASRSASFDDLAISMLHWLDELHNINCTSASRLMGPLKRFGLRTILHLNTYGDQQSTADIRLALAYEHSYHTFIPSTEAMSDYLCSMGIPKRKIAVL